MSLSALRWDPTDPHHAAPLREEWRRASERAGWAFPSDWYVPAVDAVAEAVLAGRDTGGAGVRLGAARADAGVGMAEALDDVLALGETAELGERTTADLVRAVAVGWAERTPVPDGTAPCEDPLTRLVTPDYLRTRLAEIYREAEQQGASVAERYALVVVDLGSGRPGGSGARGKAAARWTDAMRMVVVAESLRATFSGGETLAGFGIGRAVACVGRDPALGGRLRVLRELLDRDRAIDASRPVVVRVWLESLPESAAAGAALLEELTR